MFYPGRRGHPGAYPQEVVGVNKSGVVKASGGAEVACWGGDVVGRTSRGEGGPEDPRVTAGVEDLTSLPRRTGVHLERNFAPTVPEMSASTLAAEN